MKVFADRKFLPANVSHTFLLKPFWGGQSDHDGFLKFIEWARVNWQLVQADEADVAILPFDGAEILHPKDRANGNEVRRCAQNFVNLAQSFGLTTVVIVNSDSLQKLRLEGDVLILRTSLDRRIRDSNEFALMATHDDIVSTHLNGIPPIRQYSSVPTVSFCGHVASHGQLLGQRLRRGLARALRRIGIYWPESDGMWTRRQAIRLLESTSKVHTSFILREEYFGGVVNESPSHALARKQYIDNILGSDYVLCVRGYGNFSFRFFEAMSLGRTPLLVDTECVLPFDFLHNYADIIVIVPSSKISRIGDRVKEFHAQFKAGEYEAHQHRIRRVWEEWLSPKGYFSNLPALLKEARESETSADVVLRNAVI